MDMAATVLKIIRRQHILYPRSCLIIPIWLDLDHLRGDFAFGLTGVVEDLPDFTGMGVFESFNHLRKHRHGAQGRGFFPAIHDVHVLHRLTGGAFDQVVDGGDEDDVPFIPSFEYADMALIDAPYRVGGRRLARPQHMHERLVGVCIRQCGVDGGDACAACTCSVDRRDHAPAHRDEMRGEIHSHRRTCRLG